MKHLTIIAIVTSMFISTRAADAPENYAKHCVACHGKDGKGQTTMGKKINSPDLTTTKYKDDEAFAKIKEGVKKDGKEVKKPFAAKLTDDEIKELVKFTHTFAAK